MGIRTEKERHDGWLVRAVGDILQPSEEAWEREDSQRNDK